MPRIKFWLDAESFKSSAQISIEQSTASESKCVNSSRMHRRTKSFGGKSNSFDCDSNGFSDNISFNSQSDHLDTVDCAAAILTRHSGDGSSDANSMTNLSDICEQNTEIDTNDDKNQNISFNDIGNGNGNDKNHNIVNEAEDMQKELCENGRKGAIGASSDDGDLHESQTTSQGLCSMDLQASLALDAMRIFKKYLINRKSSNYVEIPATILSQISLALCYDRNVGSIEDDAAVDELTKNNLSTPMPSIATIFDAAQNYVLDQIDKTYTNAFFESAFYCRYCVDVLSGDNLHITDILYNEAAIFYFMEFLEVDNHRQYLDFWLAAINFKQQINQTNNDNVNYDKQMSFSCEQAQNDALILYEKYFSLQAQCPLKLPDCVRFNVEEKICSIDGNVIDIGSCFDYALAIIERFLERKYLRSFVKSPLFIKYLSELLQRLDAGKTPQIIEKPKSFLTPIKSISSQNTLLAMDSTKKRQQIKSSATINMNIDSRQLRDPDMLWKRSELNGLNFGRVDALGRYERDYEIAPFADRNNLLLTNPTTKIAGNSLDTGIAALQTTGNKIKQAVRKLVHLPEDKIQEEIAWQVAEMIVKDITNITLSPTEPMDNITLPE